MKRSQLDRRRFMKDAAATAAGMMVFSGLTSEAMAAARHEASTDDKSFIPRAANRIKFSVIGINHGHINSQVEAVTRGGGEFVSFYAKEPELAAAFAKRYPKAKQAASAKEILEDKSVQL